MRDTLKPYMTSGKERPNTIEARDGTKLAADIIRPSVNGTIVSEPLPLIWMLTRYHRAHFREDGTVETIVDEQWYSPFLRKLIKHGYIVACVDARGTRCIIRYRPAG